MSTIEFHTDLHTLSLHDSLPIYGGEGLFDVPRAAVLAVTQAGPDVEQALEVGGRVAHCCFRNGRQVDVATLVSGRSAFRMVVHRAMAESQANVIQCRRSSAESRGGEGCGSRGRPRLWPYTLKNT